MGIARNLRCRNGTPLDLRLRHGKKQNHSAMWPLGCRLVTGRFVLGFLYWENGPKSENWETLTRDRPKVVFPLTAVTESGTVSEQSVSAVTETKPKLIAHLRPKPEVNVCPIVKQIVIHRHNTHSMKTYCALLTSVSNFSKKNSKSRLSINFY